MGTEWGLGIVDPSTGRDIEGDSEFNPHPYDPEEFDTVLCGDWDGPLSQLLETTEPDPDDPDFAPEGGTVLIPAETVRRLGMQIVSVAQSDFAPKAIVLEKSTHSILEGDQDAYYEHLVQTVCLLQKFIQHAAKSDLALVLWYAC